MSLEKLESAAELSGDIQSAANFVISFIFAIIYLKSFYCSSSSSSQTQNHNINKKPAIKNTNRNAKKNTNPHITRVSMLYVMTYTLRYLLFIILWILRLKNISIPFIWEEEILEYIFDIAFVIGSFLFNLLMILRLQTGFKGTMYETKKYALIILYTLLIISFIMNEFYFIIRHNRKKEEHIFYHDKSKHEYGVHTYLFLVLVIINFLLGAILMYLFNKNVWALVEFRQSANSKLNLEKHPRNRRSTIDTLNRTMDHMSKKFFGIAIKYTLLCSVCIVFTNIQFFGWILLQFNVIEEYESILWFDIIWSWLFDVVLFTNFLCIWLSFPFSKWLYSKKYICGYWSDKCEGCCVCIVGAQIYDNEKERMEERIDEYIETNGQTPVTPANQSNELELYVKNTF